MKAAAQRRHNYILLNYTIGIYSHQFAKIDKKYQGIFTIPEKKKNFRKWRKHNIYTRKKKWYSKYCMSTLLCIHTMAISK